MYEKKTGAGAKAASGGANAMTSDVDILTEARRLLKKGTRLALCTVIEKKGSGPREVGAKMIVREGGATYGTIGGGALEKALVDQCIRALEEHTGRTVTFNMTSDRKLRMIETGLMCGGQMTVFVDTVEPDPRLIIVGSGHVALPLARLAEIVGFGIIIIDDDAERATEERFPTAERVITGDFASAVGDLEVYPTDFVVIVHGEPEHDYIALKTMVAKKPTYIGLLGSRTKVAHLVRRLQTDGIGAGELTMLHAPVGVAIGAQTPEEIGISILAEVIRHKRAHRQARKASRAAVH
ncbi:MAG: XdhC family protein [Halobacteriota archaeon]